MKRYPTRKLTIHVPPKDSDEKHEFTSAIIRHFREDIGRHLVDVMASEETIEKCINKHVCETNEVKVITNNDIEYLTIELY